MSTTPVQPRYCSFYDVYPLTPPNFPTALAASVQLQMNSCEWHCIKMCPNLGAIPKRDMDILIQKCVRQCENYKIKLNGGDRIHRLHG